MEIWKDVVGCVGFYQVSNYGNVKSLYKNHRFAFYEDYINKSVPKYKGKYKKKASETLWR